MAWIASNSLKQSEVAPTKLATSTLQECLERVSGEATGIPLLLSIGQNKAGLQRTLSGAIIGNSNEEDHCW